MNIQTRILKFIVDTINKCLDTNENYFLGSLDYSVLHDRETVSVDIQYEDPDWKTCMVRLEFYGQLTDPKCVETFIRSVEKYATCPIDLKYCERVENTTWIYGQTIKYRYKNMIISKIYSQDII
jgi:hypothetical protein